MVLLLAGMLMTAPIEAATQPVSRLSPDPLPSLHEPPHHLAQNADSAENASLRNVFASALSFIEPRTLEEHSLKELSLWGIAGILHTDPSFSTETLSSTHSQESDTFLLRYRGQLILTRPFPRHNKRMEWVDFILTIIQTGASHSQPLRKAEDESIISDFFAHLFHHIDPYSHYVGPFQAHQAEHNAHDNDASIGLTLTRHKEVSYPVISAVNVNSNAWEEGISVGQSLLSINGHDVRHVPLNILKHWLSGAPDSKVVITVRSSSGETQTLALARTHLPPETVFLSYSGHYPILRITHFSEHTADEMSQILSALVSGDPDTPQEGDSDPASQRKTLPGLILDLRGNHGGVLQQAVVTAALFLDHGVITTTEGRHPMANHIWAIQGGDLTNNTPLAVLVDGQTASAAEVLASALADHHRAALVGSNTYGKGLVQIMGDLPNHGELFVSWGRNIAPLGWPIQTLGVFPQLCTTRLSLSAQLSALKHGHSLEQQALYQARNQRTPVSTQIAHDIRTQCPPDRKGDATDIDAASRLLSSSPAYRSALQSVPPDLSSPSHF